MPRIIIFFIAVIAQLSSAIAYSAEPKVDKVAIINTMEDIRISFEIKNAFTKDIEEGIKSGISTTFTFFVEVYHKRTFWFNETVASLSFRHTIKYDTLKEEYGIITEERLQNPLRVKDFEQAKKIMASGDNIVVIPASNLKKGKQYHLRLKATLDAVDLPFPLNYMLFFVSFWNYETGWYEDKFEMQ